MVWRILVMSADGTAKDTVGVDDAIASLTDFSVDAAGSCLEASFTAVPSQVDISARDIITLQVYESGAWVSYWRGFVTLAGNPRSDDLQEYRAVGLKQRFYERVLEDALVEGADVATMVGTAVYGMEIRGELPTGVVWYAPPPEVVVPPLTFELGDRYPMLESVGAFLDFMAESVGAFIVPTGESYTYDGVTYSAGDTVPAVMWGTRGDGTFFFGRPQASSVAGDEGDATTRVTWTGISAEEVVTSPVLVYASGMSEDGWREYTYYKGGRFEPGYETLKDTSPVPGQPLSATPLGVSASDAQRRYDVPGPLDYMTLVPSWTLVSQAGMTDYANAYDNDLATYATGNSTTFEAGVTVRSGDLGAPAQGIVRVRYKNTLPLASYWPGDEWPPRLQVSAQSPGAPAVAVEYARVEYDLPVRTDAQELLDVYYAFLLPAGMTASDRAAATEVKVGVRLYQEDGTVIAAPALYNIMFYTIDDEAALRLAQALKVDIAPEVATVEVQSLGAATQSLDLTPVTGSTLTNLRVERTSYRITVEDGVVTTYHVGQAFEPDLEAQRIVLERLARKANNNEPVSKPKRSS